MRWLQDWLGTACLFGCELWGFYDTVQFINLFPKYILKSQILTNIVSPR